MDTQAGNRAGHADGYFAPIAGTKYLELTTFKRDGTPVATPVHVVVNGDRAVFRSWDPSGKWKRLRHTQRVLVAPCTFRGRRRGPAMEARARLLHDEESRAAARALAGKHPVLHGVLIPWLHRRRGWRTVQFELSAP